MLCLANVASVALIEQRRNKTNQLSHPRSPSALYSIEIERQRRPRATNEIGMMSAHTSSILNR